ncbi:hypothetical protein VTN77DRAFT_9628 [Rasamsonia byssochlamydoides]|uniref:uncharacterized protein n=1 Tax=Rasamsonia byssochlamydoides TaxID=89139 RepID=UPI0037433982
MIARNEMKRWTIWDGAGLDWAGIMNEISKRAKEPKPATGAAGTGRGVTTSSLQRVSLARFGAAEDPDVLGLPGVANADSANTMPRRRLAARPMVEGAAAVPDDGGKTDRPVIYGGISVTAGQNSGLSGLRNSHSPTRRGNMARPRRS